MGTFQTDVLDKVAQVLGGAADSQTPHFFDGSPISGLVGCFSVAPAQIDRTPVAIILLDEFAAELDALGSEENEDRLRLLILVAPYKIEAQIGDLAPYRDTVPAAFRSHMQLLSAPGAMDAFITTGRGGIHEWRGSPFLAYEFTLRVRRSLAVTYSS